MLLYSDLYDWQSVLTGLSVSYSGLPGRHAHFTDFICLLVSKVKFKVSGYETNERVHSEPVGHINSFSRLSTFPFTNHNYRVTC